MSRILKRDSLVTIGSLMLLAAGYYFLIYRPGMSSVSQMRRSITAAKQQVGAIPARVAHLESLKNDVVRREDYLRDALKQFPHEEDLHRVIAEVTRFAEGAGFKIVRLEPLPRVTHETYAIVPFQATLTGSFQSLGRFLTALEGHSRLFTIRELTITRENEKVGGREKLDINFAVYVLQGEKPEFSNKPDSSAAALADSRIR
ncbi:MAG: type 4a pilus biogenesis protein PilO [Planctomycetaceae bacterium]